MGKGRDYLQEDADRIARAVGIPVKRKMAHFESTREYKARIRREAKGLPKETRQAALDAFRRGEQSLDDMAKSCGITIYQLLGVVLINTKRTTTTSLNEETV